MRKLGAIVGIWLGIVGNTRQDGSASPFFSYQVDWFRSGPERSRARQQGAERPLGGEDRCGRRTLPDRLADAMSMLRSSSQNPQYQHVERALKQLEAIFLPVALSHDA